MTTLPTNRARGRTAVSTDVPTARRAVVAGAAIGILAVIIEGAALVFAKTTSGTGHYRHAGDYWLTAAALPHALAAVLVIFGIRALQRSRDGRLGLVGCWLTSACLAVLAGACVASLAVRHDVQLGPTYVLATLGTLIGMALFCAGSWRTGLLPRWLLAVWPVVWVIGSFAAVSASPLLLAALYVAIVVILHRQSTRL